MHIPKEQLEEIRRLIRAPKIEVILSTEWNSSKEGYREELRQHLAHSLQNQITQFTEIKKLMDLNQIPTPPGMSLSIAHCPLVGGFAKTIPPNQIGFDVEVDDRVSAQSIARISKPDEVRIMPSPSHLWVAKEAAFKALFGKIQPKTQSQIEIVEAYNYDEHLIHYAYRAPNMAKNSDGCVLQMGPVSLAIAIF